MQRFRFCFVSLFVLLAQFSFAQDLSGTYQGAGLTLTLEGSQGVYQGQSVSEAGTFPVSAMSQDGVNIAGAYEAQGFMYYWQGLLQGSTLYVQLQNGLSYQLQRVQGGQRAGAAQGQGWGGNQSAPTAPAPSRSQSSSAVVQQWDQGLRGARLTLINTNYTSSYGGGGATITIDLCASGRFHYRSESSVYVPDGGGVGAASLDRLSGSWELFERNGQCYLRGRADNGQTQDYLLTYKNGKVTVDGRSYAVERGRAQCY